MTMKMLTTPEDLQWARDAHNAPEWAQCIVLHGNEDWPDKMECYRVAMPAFDATPDATVLCFDDAPDSAESPEIPGPTDTKNLVFIARYETVHTGGNCMADLIELQDGRAICIADECIALYPSVEAFHSGDWDDFSGEREADMLTGENVYMARVDNAEQRSPIGLTFVERISTYEPDGPVSVDLLHLPDGRVIGINAECLVVYPTEAEFEYPSMNRDYPALDLIPTTDDDERSNGPRHA